MMQCAHKSKSRFFVLGKYMLDKPVFWTRHRTWQLNIDHAFCFRTFREAVAEKHRNVPDSTCVFELTHHISYVECIYEHRI